MVIDFTYIMNGCKKGTFQVGLDIALKYKEKGNNVDCVTCSSEDARYLRSYGLKTKYIKMSKYKAVRLAQRWMLFRFSKIMKEKTVYFVGTHALSRRQNSISILHDLYIYDMPNNYNLLQYLYYYWISIPSCLKNSRRIIVLSNTLRNRLIEEFGIDKNRIKKHNYNYRKAAKYTKYRSRERDTLLIVSTGVANKNQKEIFSSIKKIALVQKKLRIKLVTSNHRFSEEINALCKRLGIRSDCFSDIDDEELLNLYDSCEFYLSCSRVEGYGLGTREATVRGCCVVIPLTKINYEAGMGKAIYYEDVSSIPELLAARRRG